MQEEQEKQKSHVEKLKEANQKIINEINFPLPRVGNRVLIDLKWTENSPREPQHTTKGRIIGVNVHGFYVRTNTGTEKQVPHKAVKLD
jgi:hypothetical protein